MSYTGIHNLALELVQEIISYATAPTSHASIEVLSKQKLSNLRLVCQSFKYVVDPLFFSEIKLYCRKDYGRFTSNQRFLKTMTDGTSPFCRYAKVVRIGSVSQALNKPHKSNMKRPVCSDNALMRALVSLKNVRTVHWELQVFKSTYTTIISALKELSHLEALHLSFGGWKDPEDSFPLKDFPNLRSLVIGGHGLSKEHASHLVRQIHEMLIGGATLTNLSLDAPHDNRPGNHVLNEIFQDVPCHATPALRRLRLHGHSLVLDAVTLPQMRSLRALDLSLANGVMANGPLWDALRTESVHLTEIAIQNSDDTEALIRYLQSYRGLEQLTISTLRWKNIGAANSLQNVVQREDHDIEKAQKPSNELLRNALLLHKGSLVSYLGFNAAWICAPSCMTDETMLLLSKCTNLRTLGFSWSTLNLRDVKKRPDLMRMVETALALPHIESIQIQYSEKRNLRSDPQRARAAVMTQLHRIHTSANDILMSVRIADFGRRCVEECCEVKFCGVQYALYTTEEGSVGLRKNPETDAQIWSWQT